MSVLGFLKTALGDTAFVRVSDIEPLPVYVQDGAGGTPSPTVAGQVIIASTNTPVQLPSNAIKNGVIVKSLSSNSASCQTTSTDPALVNTVTGSGAHAGFILEPGEAAPFIVSNTNQIYVNGTIGDIFSYIGS